ncbi:MAG: DUF5615 family PIN-like protein [Anaerolineae bacterium]
MGDEAQRREKLYLDHDISHRITEQLRARSHDAIGAWEVGNAELPDQAQLEYAADQGRVLVTCNAQDFAPRFLETVTATEMRDMICNLAEFKGSQS